MEDNEFYKTLGAVLREERKKRHITQQQIGQKIGVSKAMVSYMELGRRTIMAKQLADYCDYLGISIQYVFDRCK